MRRARSRFVGGWLCLILGVSVPALPGGFLARRAAAGLSDAKRQVAETVDARADATVAVAELLWRYAELGYQEKRSSSRLQIELRDAGFSVLAGVADMPTAFVATAGSGEPVIGILAEYDALPGLSQEALPRREARVPGGAGHACGHHLFGAASVAAAVAVKQWMDSEGVGGTLRVYGTPAEEGGAGKAYMARAGLFADVDAVLHWHPRDRNEVTLSATLANKSAKFRFRGESAHASAAPERGRSALDGVEAMTFMVNLLREHVPQETRIHYVVTRGGDAPNIVPENAEVFLYARHPDARILLKIWQRIVDASTAAALGTGTRVSHEVIHGSHSVLANRAISARLQANLEALGGVAWSAADRAFAEELYPTLRDPDLALGSEKEIQPTREALAMASTDVGDVSWNTPTAGFSAASWVPGTPSHSWQAVAAGGTPIGWKGMQLAAKTLAMTAVDLFGDASLRAAATREFEAALGDDFVYESLVGDRAPPLDYRH